MLWVLKRTVSINGSFEHPKHMFKLMGKKIFTNLRSKICLSKPVLVTAILQANWIKVDEKLRTKNIQHVKG